jgi:hypothetical protein
MLHGSVLFLAGETLRVRKRKNPTFKPGFQMENTKYPAAYPAKMSGSVRARDVMPEAIRDELAWAWAVVFMGANGRMCAVLTQGFMALHRCRSADTA